MGDLLLGRNANPRDNTACQPWTNAASRVEDPLWRFTLESVRTAIASFEDHQKFKGSHLETAFLLGQHQLFAL